tara:strand:+ start:2262 stop:3065 length:804 start_codon:yes stop_codon:yes gene_type:complete
VSNKKIYFAQPWGGLGDNLCYSNLPRLYSKIGYDFNVSILNYSRNKEINDLVWRKNKYVKSVSSFKLPNAGYIMFNKKQVNNPKYNIVQTINELHGFEPGNGFPEIYIERPIFEKSKFSAVADLNSFSLMNTQGIIYDSKYLKSLKEELSKDMVQILEFPNIYRKEVNEKNNISINSLDSLIVTLLSTDVFYCLNSGSHSLAATLKNYFGYPKKIICFNPESDKKNIKEWGYIYPNVNYENIPSIKNLEAYLPRKMNYYQKILNFIS